MKEGKYRYLFHNMALFTVSSFVSKLLVFLLVPFYTSVLTEGDYGIADVMQSTLLLTVPLLSLNAGEAALRFGLEEKESHDRILWYGLKRVAASILFVGCAVLALSVPGAYRSFFLLFFALYFCDSLYEYMILYCQGTDHVQIMITGSVSCTVLVILSNLLFLLALKLRLTGYLLAQMVSFLGAALLMFFLVGGPERLRNVFRESSREKTTELWKQGPERETEDQNLPDRSLEREMGEYGRSMLLYSTASWVNNAVDRYYILFMLGSVQNGLYGVAYRIPAILTTVQRIFAQAWQMSAVKEYKGEDRVEFFSEMYRTYQAVLALGCGGILLLLKPIAFLLFRKGFYSAWTLVPPLLLSVVFGALEGFLGSICLAFKDGKSMGRATGAGALLNLVLNYFWIRSYGAFGAALSTLLSYFVMFALAFLFVRRHVKLKIPLLRDAAALSGLLLESTLLLLEVRYFYLLDGLILLLLGVLYFRELRSAALKILKK